MIGILAYITYRIGKLAVEVPIAIVLFILTLRGLSSAKTATKGNILGMIGMALVIASPLLMSLYPVRPLFNKHMLFLLMTIGVLACGGLIGYRIAKKVNMTALPQLLAAFHSLVGLSAVLIAWAVHTAPTIFGIKASSEDGIHISPTQTAELALGLVIGAITFTGSLVAAGKLHGIIKSTFSFSGRKFLTKLVAFSILLLLVQFYIYPTNSSFYQLSIVSALMGYLLIMPIGGADMPVIVSMLNSYSGWAAAGIGFTLNNTLLIVIGALVGTSGAILSNIMCKGMNRSLKSIIGGNTATDTTKAPSSGHGIKGNVKICCSEDAAVLLNNATSVIVVPGYGMAVSQAQHAIKELSEILVARGTSVRYAIHPVAGRMPGHMNVLLAEADIPYEAVFELDEINRDFSMTDVVLVIGANDITNPAAKTDPDSPIYGMPILDVAAARTVLFVKRTLGTGYAGVDNNLFYKDNTLMLLGDAKKVIETVIDNL
jgi:NAD(P) transhydrogenase subunit beta